MKSYKPNKKDKKWFLISSPKLVEQMWYWDENGNLIIPKEYFESKRWVGSKGDNIKGKSK